MPSYEEEPPALVRNLVPDPATEKTLNTKENKEEERRTMLELLDKENDSGFITLIQTQMMMIKLTCIQERNTISIDFLLKRVKFLCNLIWNVCIYIV